MAAESNVKDKAPNQEEITSAEWRRLPTSNAIDDEPTGTWQHAAFHVTTTIATPAAYAPLPFAVASLGWPLGN